jgi:hypothetical protein
MSNPDLWIGHEGFGCSAVFGYLLWSRVHCLGRGSLFGLCFRFGKGSSDSGAYLGPYFRSIESVSDLSPNLRPIHGQVSSGSPYSLVYYGGEEEDALKHKIIYVAEAAILAERNGVESPLTIMLRLLISEARIDHQVTVPRPNAPAQTEHIRRNGPVVVLVTSARNNIEEELLTRLMTSDADESQEQTVNVLAAALTDEEDEEKVKDETDRWLDYQRWLALDAPYDVVIPFRRAILLAILARQKAAEERSEKPKFRLRIRRDIHGFQTAIWTSAILHKSQREKDSKGRIVATIDATPMKPSIRAWQACTR